MRLISVIHAVHTQNGRYIDQAPVNTNYEEVLENPCKVNCYVVGTKTQAADICRRFNIDQIRVVPPGCSEDSIAETKRVLDRVVYVARYSQEKQHQLAVEIFANVLTEVTSAQLHFYGSGELKSIVETQVLDLGLGGAVYVHGYSEDIRSIYRSAGLSILTSCSEGYPLGIVESIQQGCPVIANDIRYGPRDMIIDGVNGYLVPEDS